MQIYRVGGAVRDKLLGLPVKDHDWVVVGSTPELMKQQGFQPIGRDFPVFLHPETREEYALARTERKSGHGYAGFTFHTSSTVTLEEDLLRRDLTINAMAEDESGNIIDPYGGQKDLAQRQLRNVSPAFQEDPLRILRVARFAARLNILGFTIADSTLDLMRTMVSNGEASYLVPERVWQETINALIEPNPEVYFQTLESCGALQVVMPELKPFINNRTLNLLSLTAKDNGREQIRFGCLFIPALPQTTGDQNESLQYINALSTQLRLPIEYSELALMIASHSDFAATVCRKPDATLLMTLFERTDAIRRPDRFYSFMETLGYGIQEVYNRKKQVMEWFQQCQSIKARDVISESIKGKAIGEALRKARIAYLQDQIKSGK